MYVFRVSCYYWHVSLHFKTRKVKVPALNDSQAIGVCVYNIMILSIIGVGITLVMQVFPSVPLYNLLIK